MSAIQFHEATATSGAPLKVWEMPNGGERYVLGADTAEGLEHGDYSCAQVLSLASGRQVASWHGHIPADLFGHELNMLGRWYNGALIGVESNNHGLTTITALRNQRYPYLFRKKTLNSARTQQTLEYGWKTTTISKPLMIDELAKALREGSITVRDYQTLAELKTYVRDEKGRTNGSPYDDRVMALALAVQMTKHAYQPEYVPQTDDYMSGEWWARQIPGVVKSDLIGQHAMRQPANWH